MSAWTCRSFDGKAAPQEGPPGSGKTTFGLQFLLQGVREGETCLLASDAETLEQLKSIAASHAWNLDGIHVTEFTEPAARTGDDEGSGYTLFPEAEVDLGETLEHLFAEIERLRPTRLVLDTISILRILAPTPGFYRKPLKRIRDFMLGQSCTTLMLDEASRTDEKEPTEPDPRRRYRRFRTPGLQLRVGPPAVEGTKTARLLLFQRHSRF